MEQALTLRPIGIVRSPQTEMSKGGWARIESRIELAPEWAEGLAGLDEFSHVIVLFALDRARFDRAEHLTRQPRGRAASRRLRAANQVPAEPDRRDDGGVSRHRG